MSTQIIKILGIASQSIIKDFAKVLNITNKQNEIVVFCDYSEYEIPLDTTFNIIKDPIHDLSIEDQNFTLKNVTQQYHKPFTSIPKGHKTICRFEFNSGRVPPIVLNLPIIRDWYGSRQFLIFS
jgi:hypothetical protein